MTNTRLSRQTNSIFLTLNDFWIFSRHLRDLFVCELCDYKTRWSSDLKRHIKKVHALVWKCDYCNFTTEVSREFLQDHHQQVHQGLPFYNKAKSLRVSGEQPRLMIEEASNTLESVLEGVDPAHHPIYKGNWDAIRTNSFEPKNSDFFRHGHRM